jgi:hypothetical protein
VKLCIAQRYNTPERPLPATIPAPASQDERELRERFPDLVGAGRGRTPVVRVPEEES